MDGNKFFELSRSSFEFNTISQSDLMTIEGIEFEDFSWC